MERSALITGASSGIGAETEKKFAVIGAHVLPLARNGDRLNQIAKGIEDTGGKADVFPVDVGNWKALKELSNFIGAEKVVPDMIINNVGGGKWSFIEETWSVCALDKIGIKAKAIDIINELPRSRAARYLRATARKLYPDAKHRGIP
ncbi:MAG: SDR family NAD(P)-dependent oxidoreductase [Dissulfurispiraceae bacterium]